TGKSSLLDLGSGTGLIVNELTNDFEHITAVELFKEFSDYIKGKNIEIYNENLIDFYVNSKFGIATMFGTAHYFNDGESLEIYKNIFNMLDDDGIFILKNQFGLEKTKTVNESVALGNKYFAQYRHIDYEVKRLEAVGFRNIQVHDIYPAEANRWDDTHFYALVCEKMS
ncbi:MAG: methyltransferase domain-containing protein, partial [Paracoccaceae bacterium]